MKSFLFLVLATVLFFFACENDMDEVMKITGTESNAEKNFSDVHLIYTDSGSAKAVMAAPFLEVFVKNEKEKWVFPKGLKVDFYDKDEKHESVLTANYGIFDQQQRKLLLQNEVVMINLQKHDTLNTELLNWSQDSAKLFTDKMVILKRPDGTYRCQKGITANETFSWYDFKFCSLIYTHTEE